MGDFSCLQIDDICCEWGAPEYVMTDDGEAWYWRFPGHDLPVADNLSELLIAALQLKRMAIRLPASPVAEGESQMDVRAILGDIIDRIDMAPNDDPLPYVREHVMRHIQKFSRRS